MTKYRQAYLEMVAANRQQFDEFKKIHDLYQKDQGRWEEKFNELGKPILRIVEKHENRLCGKMEGAGRGMYSSALGEKFRQEVRKYLPLIDLVGVKIS